MSAIRVILVDDQPVFRTGLRTLLSMQPDIEVVGEASNGAEAIACSINLDPEVILMDVQMPILDGVQATAALQEQVPTSRVLLLTTFDDDAYVFRGLQAGAVGYLLKDAEPDDIVKAIRAAAQGTSVLHPSVASKVVAELNRLASTVVPQPRILSIPLSDREIEIIRLVAAGNSNREIAVALNLTEGTVKNYVRMIMTKLAARDRAHAAVTAKDYGII